jgi:hypothetical protein
LSELKKYHFIMTMGSLYKFLDRRLARRFPTIQGLFDQAQHFHKEGPRLRNMVEHILENLEEEAKGKPRKGFVRELKLPGITVVSKLGTAIVDGKHWLGGLCVETIISEVRPMYEAAMAIPEPHEPRES